MVLHSCNDQFNSIILRWFTAMVLFFINFKVYLIKMSIRKSHIDKLPTQLKDMEKLFFPDLCQKAKTATRPYVTSPSR